MQNLVVIRIGQKNKVTFCTTPNVSSVYEDATSLERATKQEKRTLAKAYITKIDALLVTRMS